MSEHATGRVVHISTADNSGGAARAAYRLHRGLRASGWDSRMLVSQRVTSDPDVATVRPNWKWKVADRVVGEVLERVGLQDVYYPSASRLRSHAWVRRADVLQLHNLHGKFFPISAIRDLTRDRPAVWVLNDMWALTGHCVYSYDCARWMTGCGTCPLLREDYLPLRRDTTAFHWRLKRKSYGDSLLDIVAASRWMYDMAKQSPLFEGLPVHLIPYGLDLNRYRPVPKAHARALLGLPADSRIVLFSAHVFDDNPRKGTRYVFEALERIAAQPSGLVELMVMGEKTTSSASVHPFPVHYLGAVSDDLLMAAIYCAADVLVMPTLADNLPLTILESMACGTPVVAFNVGGVPDVVRHLDTGYLVEPRDVAGLAAGISLLLGDPELRARLSERCREVMVTEYSLELQVSRYANLYSSLRDR